VIVSLTPEGEAMRNEVDAIMTAIGEAAGCTPEEMAGMREMLQRLRKSLNAAAGG
jgi:DNA-binding MarR family transcriptional regulator